MIAARRKTARNFVERFCAGDVEGLVPLLAEGLRFDGPLHRFECREAYLASLRAEPPEPTRHRLLALVAEGTSVAAFYEYQKSEGALVVAQHFRFEGDRIAEILVVFDARGFAPGGER